MADSNRSDASSDPDTGAGSGRSAPNSVVRGVIGARGRGRRRGMGLVQTPVRPRAFPTSSSPTRKTPLTNAFERPSDLQPSFSSPSTTYQVSSLSRQPSLRLSTWSKLPGRFPNWSSSLRADGGLSPLGFQFRKAKMVNYESSDTFKEAAKEVGSIRNLALEREGTSTDRVLEQNMSENMSYLIFGSNQISGVGLDDKRETLKLCEEILMHRRHQLDPIAPRSDQYREMLEELVLGRSQQP